MLKPSRITRRTTSAMNDSHVVLDADSCVPFQNFICKMFKTIYEKLESMSHYKSIAKNRDLGFDMAEKIATEDRKAVSMGLRALSNFVSRSPAFRKHLMHPGIMRWLAEAAEGTEKTNTLFEATWRNGLI